MEDINIRLHKFFNELQRYDYEFDYRNLPANGIYVVFEKGEVFNSMDRIVRVGTHTGNNKLPSRLKEHLLTPNKNRSIFRKT